MNSPGGQVIWRRSRKPKILVSIPSRGSFWKISYLWHRFKKIVNTYWVKTSKSRVQNYRTPLRYVNETTVISTRKIPTTILYLKWVNSVFQYFSGSYVSTKHAREHNLRACESQRSVITIFRHIYLIKGFNLFSAENFISSFSSYTRQYTVTIRFVLTWQYAYFLYNLWKPYALLLIIWYSIRTLLFNLHISIRNLPQTLIL